MTDCLRSPPRGHPDFSPHVSTAHRLQHFMGRGQGSPVSPEGDRMGTVFPGAGHRTPLAPTPFASVPLLSHTHLGGTWRNTLGCGPLSLCAGLVTQAAQGKKEGNPCVTDGGPRYLRVVSCSWRVRILQPLEVSLCDTM